MRKRRTVSTAALDNLVECQIQAHAAHQDGKQARIVLVPNIHAHWSDQVPQFTAGPKATGTPAEFQVDAR